MMMRKTKREEEDTVKRTTRLEWCLVKAEEGLRCEGEMFKALRRREGLILKFCKIPFWFSIELVSCDTRLVYSCAHLRIMDYCFDLMDLLLILHVEIDSLNNFKVSIDISGAFLSNYSSQRRYTQVRLNGLQCLNRLMACLRSKIWQTTCPFCHH